MIVVIADDLTGAAELGGLGLRYGLTVEIITSGDLQSTADLLVIAMDTRSMNEQQAVAAIAGMTAKIAQLKPDLIFKKVDSVLRGHIIAELKIQLKLLGLNRAILVPANPSFGRTMTDGQYFIHGEPIHLTSFANDPEFAIKSSHIHEMLRVDLYDIHVSTTEKTLPLSGIIIGECGYADDLLLWADKADNTTLMAGGAGLFNAMISSLNLKPVIDPGVNGLALGQPALFICGSNFNKSKQLVEQVNSNHGPVSYMPLAIVTTNEPAEDLFDLWAAEISAMLKLYNTVIVAIDENTTADIEIMPGSLREKKAKVVDLLLKRIAIKELVIEGGATAGAIINRIGINRFIPVQEFGTGVIRMQITQKEGVFLTLKPGSYDWPQHIWNF